MKRVILHIGYNKTGTTAIQNSFYYNRKNLMRNGLCYPVKCRGKRKSPAHHSLAESLLFRIGKPLPNFVNPKIYSKYPKDHYWQLLHDELAKTDCGTIFISSEAFSRLRGNREQMEFVKKQLDGFQLKVLVYLRNQVEFFESAYNQAVKRNGESRTVEEMMKSGWLSMNYFDETKQWAEVFGAENIILKTYDRSGFPDGSIVKDVLKVVGLPHLTLKPKWWQTKIDFNIRLPNNMVERKRKINARVKLPGFLDKLVNFYLSHAGKYHPEVELLTPLQKETIRQHYREANQKLGNKYLNGIKPFSEIE